MASAAVPAPSSPLAPPQSRRLDRVETWLEAERDSLVLWLPVLLGCGVAAWFTLDTRAEWLAWFAACAAVALGGRIAAPGSRLRRAILLAGLCGALGCALAWTRAERLAAPVVARPAVASFAATIERVDLLAAKGQVRLLLAPEASAKLPPRVRVTADAKDAPAGLAAGERVRLRARIVAPQGAAVPGGFDFARVAWFQSLGGVGKAMGPVERLSPLADARPSLRERLSAHIRTRLEGSPGGIAAAFASGDRGGIDPADEDAMRASGLTHLLSVSGLHVTAVVAATMFLAVRLLALSPWLALRAPLVTIAAGAGALAAIGYTLLTGAEVPTVRSCIAAVLILIGLALGREAFTLRLVAAGAGAVLLLWPEALVGPSFQLSFAAITAIVALHEHPRMRALTARRDEGWPQRIGREGLALLITGLVVEIALSPIALFHFHKSGLLGAFANIVAIPLTTFVIMPLEAGALLLDVVGFGAPLWWLTGKALALLLWLARSVAAAPGAQAALASLPTAAFALMVAGGVWIALWRTRARWLGALPLAAGAIWGLLTPPPDLIVTGDGKHLAVRALDGGYATLRPRAGDYVRSVLAERGGTLDALADLDDLPGASCGADLCRVTMRRGGRDWTVLATRSPYIVARLAFEAECARADILVSDRRLPGWCRPRWFRADMALLRSTGGLAVDLTHARIETVRDGVDAHPWVRAQ